MSNNIWIKKLNPALYVVLNGWSLAAGHLLLAAGRWSLVAGCRSKIRSYQKPVTSDRPPGLIG